MGFEKGHARVGGRTKGIPNKQTRENKERVARFFEAHWDEFESEIWPDLTAKEKKDTFVALMNYQYPKLSSVDVKADVHNNEDTLDVLRKAVNDADII